MKLGDTQNIVLKNKMKPFDNEEIAFYREKSTPALVCYIQLMCEQNEKATSGFINRLISSAKFDLKGLELLLKLLDVLPSNLLLENVVHWLNICCDEHDSLKEMKLGIVGTNFTYILFGIWYLLFLGKIIKRLSNDQDFSKKLLSDYMTKILQMCLSSQVNPNEMESALIILSISMKIYGSWFGPHKSKIEAFLLKLLFYDSKNVVQKAAVAFLELQQVSNWIFLKLNLMCT